MSGLCDTRTLQFERSVVAGKDEHRNANYYRKTNPLAFCTSVGPIQGRIMAICDSKNALSQHWLSCQNQYYDNLINKWNPRTDLNIRIGCDPCDECFCDPTIPMRTPPCEHISLLYQGHSKDGNGGGAKGYLRFRYDSGLPETRFCYPPTTNMEYGWKNLAHIQDGKSRNAGGVNYPQGNLISSFSRNNCAKPEAEPCASFRFPRFYC